MARLLVFVGFLIGTVGILFLNNFNKLPLSNTPFDLPALEKAHQEELEKLVKAKHAGEHNEEGDEKEEQTVTNAPIPLDSEELQKGYEIYYKTGKCVTCHGKNGEGKKSQKAPKIAAQHSWYLENQLKLMKSKERFNAKMNPYLKKLTDEDFKNVAAFMSKLPPQ